MLGEGWKERTPKLSINPKTLGAGEIEVKGGTLVQFGGNMDVAVVQFENSFGDGQAQARSLILPRGTSVAPVVWQEDMRDIFICYAGARI